MAISDIVVPPALSAPSENGRYVIPKGHTAVASPAFTQVDRKIWKNHAEWDPYRWIDPNGEAARALQEYLGGGEKVDYGYGIVSKGTESVYQPFGAGRHRCIGEHVGCSSRRRIFRGDLGISQFAYLQVGCILVTLARNLEFQLDNIPDSDYSVSCPFPQRHVVFLTIRQQSLFVCPQGPCTVRYRRRVTSSSRSQ
jgi:sterol 14-demethylase